MKNAGSYYLFKAGRLLGPISAEKLETLKASREIYQYSWMVDEVHQVWTPVEQMPTENPFESSAKSLKERTLSGALVYHQNPVIGFVKRMHAFGVELLISRENRSVTKIPMQTIFTLNLIDESHSKASNASVILQSAENTEEGVLLRFNWCEAPTPL